jgi:hypothetical protein
LLCVRRRMEEREISSQLNKNMTQKHESRKLS